MAFTHLKELVSLNESRPGNGFFQEARQYGDQSEFSDEFYDLLTQITKMKKVMKNPKWIDYMQTFDRQNDSSTEGPAKDAIAAITSLEDALTDIDREFDRASGSGSPVSKSGQPAKGSMDDTSDDSTGDDAGQ